MHTNCSYDTRRPSRDRLVVEQVFRTGETWWVRSGTANQEVKERDALRIQERLEETGAPVMISCIHVGRYPHNHLGEIEILS